MVQRVANCSTPNNTKQHQAIKAIKARLGQDPLSADACPGTLWLRISRSRSAIGTLLLNQSVIAGVGNVYRAEILFLLGIHPETPANRLSRKQFDELWKLTVDLLTTGVKYMGVHRRHGDHALGFIALLVILRLLLLVLSGAKIVVRRMRGSTVPVAVDSLRRGGAGWRVSGIFAVTCHVTPPVAIVSVFLSQKPIYCFPTGCYVALVLVALASLLGACLVPLSICAWFRR